MRLIDADALYEKTANWEAQALHMVEVTMYDEDKLEEWRKWSAVLTERSAFKHDIADAPTIDAVEVVHCRDCKYFGEYCDEYKEETQNDGMCELDIKDSVTFDWFCADGERKENA